MEADGELLPLVRGQPLLRVADEAEARVVHLAPAGARRDRRRAHRALARRVVRTWIKRNLLSGLEFPIFERSICDRELDFT